jgi:hypothetical protein
VKRLILALVLSLVANLVGASWVPVEPASPVHGDTAAMSIPDDCHGHHATSDAPTDTPQKHHACCSTAGLPQAPQRVSLVKPPVHTAPSLPIRPYMDVVFAIDKPPKASI